MQSVVLDTNVIISAALKSSGHPFQIMELVSAGVLRLYYSSEMLDEYTDVLSREKFNFTPEKQTVYIERIKEIGILSSVQQSNVPFVDESDRIFYDMARFYNALLITGNKRHYPDEPFILTPAEFLSSL